MINRNNLFIALVFSMGYIFSSYYFSNVTPIESDTLQYYYYYLDITNETFPLSFEYITFIVMWFSNFLGLDFRGYLFVNYLLWLPLVFCIFYKSNKDYLLFLLGLFFYTHFFMLNASFLIRQYNGFLFFLYYFFVTNKSFKSVFFIISIFSHLSSIIYFVLINKRVSDFIVKNKIIIYFTSLFMLLINFSNFLSIYFDSLGFLTEYSSLSKKINGVKDYYTDNDGVNNTFLFLNIILGLIICFFINNNRLMEVERKVISLVFFSGILYIVFSSQPITANRLGFVAFSFVIPSFIIILRGLNARLK